MTQKPSSAEGRRAQTPQAPLPRELARPRLNEMLHQRFSNRATTVVAGAGFGKTTALAQALRANLAAPSGFDAWVSCEAADEDATRLAGAIVDALGVPVLTDDPVESVVAGVRSLAPIDVCIVLDDLHELPSDSTGGQLVAALIEQLPPQGHLVLASRTPIPYQLARLRAGAQVVDLRADDLGFCSDEIAQLAGLYGQPVSEYPELGGWPSLVALSFSARTGTATDFLWEEIVGELPLDDQRLLLAMATLGWGAAEDLRRVMDDPFTPRQLDRLVQTIPLISGDHHDAGFLVHQLWEEAIVRIFDQPQIDEIRDRVVDLLDERHEILRLGSAALRWGHPQGLRSAALGLVRVSLGIMPIETARRWLSLAPVEVCDSPEFRLLELAKNLALRVDSPGFDTDIDELIQDFSGREDQRGSAEAIALAAVGAHARGDLSRLLDMAGQARSLAGAQSVPILRFLCGAIDASLHALSGDAEGALRVIETLPFGSVPAQVSELTTRLSVTMLLLMGCSDEALEGIGRMAVSSDPYVRDSARMARWNSGDPSDLIESPMTLVDSTRISESDSFIRAATIARIASALGDRQTAELARREVASYVTDHSDARISAMAAAALAVCKVLDHDEDSAARAIDEHLERHPLPNPLGELHLRRDIAVSYLVSPTMRDYWEAAALGPHHARSLAVVRQLAQVRAGAQPGELASPEMVVATLPLPWSVELAVRCRSLGVPGTDALLETLAACRLAEVRNELTVLHDGADPALSAVAAILLDELPSESLLPLEISVLGPMRLANGDVHIDAPELRRGRVRTVLALLVVLGPLRRDQLIELVWPGADVGRARQNLRTTLSRLRRLVEPDPASPRRLRSDGDILRLVGPPLVDCDLWRFRRLLDRAQTADRGAIVDIEALQAAVDLWQGDVLLDLSSIPDVTPDLERIRRELVDACLQLGEQFIAVGRLDEALQCVARSRGAAPLSERAQRLAIATHLQRGDRDALAGQLETLHAMLEELGAEPDPSTAMLVMRATEMLGGRKRR